MKPASIKEFIEQSLPVSPEPATEQRARSFWERIRERLKYPGASRSPITSEWADAPALNQREFQVLNAAALLGGEGDTVRIAQCVEYWSGRFMIAKVHAALWRLERRGLIRFHQATAGEDGPKPRTRVAVTPEGDRAIYRAETEGMPLTNC